MFKHIVIIIWTLAFLGGLFTGKSVFAGEWNEKPVICEQKEVFEKLMVKQNKILLGTGDLLATVRAKDGYSPIPAILPMRIYINFTTKEWTIVEWHQDYNSYCILGFGGNWQLLGQKL